MDAVFNFLKEYPIVMNVVTSIVILIVGRFIAKYLVKALSKVMAKVEMEPTISKFISNFTHAVLILLTLLLVLGQLGVQSTSLITVVGASGLAIGLALQGSLSNFAAGIMLVVFKPFKKGDMIFAHNIEGTVEEINIFTTILRDDFNLAHVMPNAMLTGGTITNIWSNVERRLEFNMSIAIEEDLDRVFEVLEAIFKAHPLILEKPGPFVGVRDMKDSSVNLLVWVFIHRANYRMVRFRLYKDMKEALQKQGIVIAFPQHDVHLTNEQTPKAIAS